MLEYALAGPPLGDGGELVVPHQLPHVGCSRLPSFSTRCNLLPQLVVFVEQYLLGHIVQSSKLQLVAALISRSRINSHGVICWVTAVSSTIPTSCFTCWCCFFCFFCSFCFFCFFCFFCSFLLFLADHLHVPC